ncbi:MAG: cytochrome c family protein, partial [Sphingomicrobium sp.]
PGTKMTFAGLSKPEDRANVMVFLNSRGSNLPLPAAPAAGAEPTDDAAPKAGSGSGDGAQKSENEPVLTEQQAAKSPNKNIGGEGAALVTGPSGVAKKN